MVLKFWIWSIYSNFIILSDRKTVCPKLDNPANGRVKQRGIYPGSKAFYFCKRGFTLTGDRVRVCQRNGKFSGEAATCERKQIYTSII